MFGLYRLLIWNFYPAIISCVIGCFLVLASSNVSAKEFNLKCESEKGSLYDVYFNTEIQTGEIRYRWMEQDVFYEVSLDSQSNWLITGIATFSGSLSGEEQGNPFEFVYNTETGILSELIDVQCKELN